MPDEQLRFQCEKGRRCSLQARPSSSPSAASPREARTRFILATVPHPSLPVIVSLPDYLIRLSQVRASGLGVVRGETNHTQSFNVYSREAGAGNLSVAIEGPSKAVMKFEDHKVSRFLSVDLMLEIRAKRRQTSLPGRKLPRGLQGHDAWRVRHLRQVQRPAHSRLALQRKQFRSENERNQRNGDQTLACQVFIAPATGEVRKLEIASFHDSGIPVGKAFTFTVLTHRARGHLEAKVNENHC